MSAITIHPLGTRQSLWGEGPVWWQEQLLYVDIEGHTIVQLCCDSGAEVAYSVGERVGMVVPASDGNWLYAGDNGITHFNPASDKKRLLADPEAHKRPQNRFNDGKCDPRGRLWAGTISTVKKPGDAALYRYDSQTGCQQVLADLTNSNGLCWSPCGTVFYHIDTPTQKVRAFDYDAATGAITDSRVVVDTGALNLEGSPDGMTIDLQGNLWITLCHGGAVVCCDPRQGKVLQRITFPAIETTSCCFGGAKLDRLFVTTGMPPQGKPSSSLDGYVFVVDGLGVSGAPTVPFCLSE